MNEDYKVNNWIKNTPFKLHNLNQRRRVLRNLSNIQDGDFYNNSQGISVVNCFCKKTQRCRRKTNNNNNNNINKNNNKYNNTNMKRYIYILTKLYVYKFIDRMIKQGSCVNTISKTESNSEISRSITIIFALLYFQNFG